MVAALEAVRRLSRERSCDAEARRQFLALVQDMEDYLRELDHAHVVSRET